MLDKIYKNKTNSAQALEDTAKTLDNTAKLLNESNERIVERDDEIKRLREQRQNLLDMLNDETRQKQVIQKAKAAQEEAYRKKIIELEGELKTKTFELKKVKYELSINKSSMTALDQAKNRAIKDYVQASATIDLFWKNVTELESRVSVLGGNLLKESADLEEVKDRNQAIKKELQKTKAELQANKIAFPTTTVFNVETGESTQQAASSYTDLQKSLERMRNELKQKTNQLKRKRDEQEQSMECVICYNAKRNFVFRPCGHLACCQDCGHKPKFCPICNTEVDKAKSMKLYIP